MFFLAPEFSLRAEYPFSPPFGLMGSVDKRQATGVIVGRSGTIGVSIKPELDEWFLVNSPFGGDDVNDVVWDAMNRFWIAVGDKGKIAISRNGIRWIPIASTATEDFLAVDSYGDLSVAVGGNGSVYVSENAVDWVPGVTPPNSGDLHDVSNHNGEWIAGGYDGKLYYTNNPRIGGLGWQVWNSGFGGKDVNAIAASTETNMANGYFDLRKYYIVGDNAQVGVASSVGGAFTVSQPFSGKVFGIGTSQSWGYAVGTGGQFRSNIGGTWGPISTSTSSDLVNITRREPFFMVAKSGTMLKLSGNVQSVVSPFGNLELMAVAQKSDQSCLEIDNMRGAIHGSFMQMKCPTNQITLRRCNERAGQCQNRKAIPGEVKCITDPNFQCE